jgi:hypothetical protein
MQRSESKIAADAAATAFELIFIHTSVENVALPRETSNHCAQIWPLGRRTEWSIAEVMIFFLLRRPSAPLQDFERIRIDP